MTYTEAHMIYLTSRPSIHVANTEAHITCHTISHTGNDLSGAHMKQQVRHTVHDIHWCTPKKTISVTNDTML